MKPLPLAGALAVAVFAVARRRRLGRLELIGAALLIAALVAYGSGLVVLPNIEELLVDLGTTLGPYTYVLVGVLAFLETGAFVGLIAPGETAIMVGGLVAGQGEISIVALIALVWFCAVAGDVTSFFLGRRLGRDFLLRHGPRVKITEARLEQVERFFDRHGGKAIFLGRFVGLVRAVAPFIAGSSGMRFRRFLPYDILGAGLWAATFSLLGYIFWHSFDRVASYAGRGALALGTVIAVGAGAVYAYRRLRDPAQRKQVHAWLHRQAERPALRPLARVARPVFWRVLAPAWRFASGPLQFAGGRLTPGKLGLELTTLIAVAAVGGFAFFALDQVVGNGPTASDLDAANLAADVRNATVVDVAKTVTLFGGATLVAAATVAVALVLAWRRRLIEAAVVCAGLVVTWAAVHLAKDIIDRPRPGGGIVQTDGSSFPSGHAAYAVTWVALAVGLARVLPGSGGKVGVIVAAIALAAAVGMTRVELRAHYFTDVLAGWGMAAAIFAICGVAGLLVAHLRHNGGAS